jgi:hypothetical protein
LNASEEAGKAVRGFVDTLRDQPLSLALVVMNIALLALVGWNARDQTATRLETAKLIIEKFKATDKLLANCTDVEGVRRLLQTAPPVDLR